MMKKLLTILLSISLGAIFIVSAAVKIYPMEPFEYQFVDMGIATWNTAPYLARFFIGMEFFLGMMLVFNILLRKFTVKFAIALLSVFSIYLVYKIITEGNSGNCGCFGEALKMSPLEGILKNVFLIASSIVLYILSKEKNPTAPDPILNELGAEGRQHKFHFIQQHWKKIVIPALLITSMCLGFFIYPLDPTFNSSLDKTQINYRVPLELMYTDRQKEKPKIDLAKGKHIVAFLSLTCPHCRIAGQKIHVMQKKNPSIPFYISLNGDAEMLPQFFDDTHTQDIPHNLFLGPKDWINVAGISLPVIMYIEDGIVKKKFDGMDLSESDIEAWLKQ